MTLDPQDFQIFVKPAGAACNLDCQYCYYLKKEQLFPSAGNRIMPDIILEEYIVQHIETCPESEISFSWHGGEPTLLGLDYFRRITALQHKHLPINRDIHNAIQTNGTLLDENWCRFLASENFSVGLSLDGPEDIHNRFRRTRSGGPSFRQAIRGYELLLKHQVPTDILCVVNQDNAASPLQVYRFFKTISARYISFLPLVEPRPGTGQGVSAQTVRSLDWGNFLCTIFDEWIAQDIGKIKIQLFEETARTAFGQEHSLCIFRETCGRIPVIEHNGNFFSCDHFVDTEHHVGNIIETHLRELLESRAQKEFGQAKLSTLPRFCRDCEVRAMCNGECPKNRFLNTPDGEPGLNYLCAGYKRFFEHCRPFISDIKKIWRQKTVNPGSSSLIGESPSKTGKG